MSVLYVVGTPIGNLEDMTYRGVRTLEECDFIAAEDTRVTAKLLHHFDIHKPMVSYHAHNLRKRGEEILTRILAGDQCALVTDAGMPCISDPGEELVRQAVQAGVAIYVVPGPTAAASGLALSGLSTARFTFEGFLSVKRSSRKDHLEQLAQERRTMVFYEAPHKLLETLKDMYEAWGERRIALCRELTKLHEEVLRTTLSQAVTHYTEHSPRGEFVLVVEGSPEEETSCTQEEALRLVRAHIAEGKPLREAAKLAAKVSGLSRSLLYKATLTEENIQTAKDAENGADEQYP